MGGHPPSPRASRECIPPPEPLGVHGDGVHERQPPEVCLLLEGLRTWWFSWARSLQGRPPPRMAPLDLWEQSAGRVRLPAFTELFGLSW